MKRYLEENIILRWYRLKIGLLYRERLHQIYLTLIMLIVSLLSTKRRNLLQRAFLAHFVLCYNSSATS